MKYPLWVYIAGWVGILLMAPALLVLLGFIALGYEPGITLALRITASFTLGAVLTVLLSVRTDEWR